MSDSGELAAILRVWRERLTPHMAGLPANTTRRTKGLRREELAVLAGVSVDYIVRLEQGRASAPSAQVCAALAQALQLGDTEQEHLFRLAGHATGGGHISRLVPASIRRLVERTGERPVAVFDAMWNLLLWNRLWAALAGDPSQLREADRNLLWLHFTGTSDCHLYGPGSTEALDASLVADLRRSTGRYPDDPQPRQLAARLNETSTQFRELWQRHEIAEHGPTIKRVVHSEVGTLDLDCDILTTQRHDLRIVMYTAEPGSESDSRLALLATIGTQYMRDGPRP
ncbi:helix-turn-helix transcriptional regulator [Streptomyces hirsutus]|uniref:Helix-turn-helix transcriptional regulator n=1 Tax=Streptomyces hirsutus TaxID=35620 RepID=A0ABZ1GZB6_9ACTN|nr:helix-turn-helix transcriptional regulator [Streptomyces hirsutus]WSD10510.1 helix-turn-helix transcriptional regulator [Streptomyces hirsutus]WTD16143.1 helix-turn-helix transcriptional regulator [Streptomyces hirsutus]